MLVKRGQKPTVTLWDEYCGEAYRILSSAYIDKARAGEGDVRRDFSRIKRSTLGEKHKFRNIVSGKTVVATLAEMSRQHGMKSQNLSRLKAGRIRSCGGWKYVGAHQPAAAE
jgi:hypothetical protein